MWEIGFKTFIIKNIRDPDDEFFIKSMPGVTDLQVLNLFHGVKIKKSPNYQVMILLNKGTDGKKPENISTGSGN